MFWSKKKRIELISDTNVVITEVYKVNGRTFMMFCDAKKSKGGHGQNVNYALNILTDSGFQLIMDNRQMDIPEVDPTDPTGVTLDAIADGFKQFKAFADIL